MNIFYFLKITKKFYCVLTNLNMNLFQETLSSSSSSSSIPDNSNEFCLKVLYKSIRIIKNKYRDEYKLRREAKYNLCSYTIVKCNDTTETNTYTYYIMFLNV